MEVRVSRIIAEYYDYTRREAEDYIRQGRVTVNGSKVQISDKVRQNLSDTSRQSAYRIGGSVSVLADIVLCGGVVVIDEVPLVVR